jgi:antimicrobial peptide system SdpA family protein
MSYSQTTAPTSTSIARLSIATRMISWAAWCAIGLGVALVHSPHSPLSPGRRAILIAAPVIPEGWGFFTRNPREEQLFVYQEGVALRSMDPVDAAPNPLLEFARVRRRRSVEIAMIAELVPESAFVPARPLDELIGDESNPHYELRSPVKRPDLCGKLLFERRAPTPWSWANRSSGMKIRGRVARVSVLCA